MLVRAAQADNRAKQSKPVDLGLAAWRLGGKHLPVLASIPVTTFHSLNQAKAPPRAWNHWEVVQACQTPGDPRVTALRNLVQARVGRATDVTSLNQLLIRCASEVFPPSKGPHRLALWQDPSMTIGIKGMWQAYRQWKQLANAPTGHALQTARAYQTFKQAHKAFRQAGKACKKQWFHARIGDIQAAARRGDARALFAGVRAAAPKQSKIKVQLRDSRGQLQSPGEQLQQLEKHYRKLYAADADPEIAGETRAPVTLHIAPDAMAKALAQLSPHKATPPGQATNSIWRLTSDVVAPVLCDLAARWKRIPDEWRHAWLVLVPKVPRPVSPRNLRPIGLTEPSGRAYARLLQHKLRQHACAYLKDTTQFAYMQGREAAFAIYRVSQHCKYVQLKTSNVHRTVADRQECVPAAEPHFAGLQLSLDLSNAFDLVNWRLLDRALLDADVEVELRNQVMSWYSEVTYYIEHLNRTAQVPAQQGLRQGCQLAPLLWAISMGYVYKTVARNTTNPINIPWLQDHTSTYADDIHMMATAKTVSSLDSILLHFGTMLDALQENDMVINAGKSAFLLKHRGSFIKKWLRRHRRTTPDGDVLHFRTPKGTEYQIPLREHHTYLGVKISYHSMARHTTTHRLQAANSAWQRLRGILCSARHLALADRIALWKATVLPTLMYGLAAVGPGPKDQNRMQAMIIKHARAMTKSFAHLHHESTRHVLTRCGLRTAAKQLLKETEALLRRFRAQN